MAHGKETPRQKMIGMMYLVLTALLALNVSKDILDAFVLVDESLTATTENLTQKTQTIYDEFDKAYQMNRDKVEKWKKYADQVKKEANSLDEFINTLKIKIVQTADGKEAKAVVQNKVKTEGIESKDNTDSPAQVMVGDNNNGEGKILKQKIVAFRELLLSMVDKKDVAIISSIKKNLNTEDPPAKEGATQSWESEHFEHWPLIAVNTIMSKLQSDVRNAEAEITRYLYNNIEAGSFKFNNLEATVIPNSNYIIKGNEYNAEVFIAASDTTKAPTVYIGKVKEIKDAEGRTDYEMVGQYETLSAGKNGRALYKRIGGATGIMRWGGLIELKGTDGTIIRKPFEQEYMVAEPIAVISPTKMNVFYLGVDNPVSISVAGVPADKVTATITNGLIKKSGNSYIVNPGTVGSATVNVSAEIDGKKRQMGAMDFRVKRIPPPVPVVGAGRKGGPIERNVLLVEQGVFALLENFEFEATYKVISFTLSANVRGFNQDAPSTSNRITEQQKSIIKQVDKGARVYFNDIKAVGPDGRTVDLSTLVFKIQ